MFVYLTLRKENHGYFKTLIDRLYSWHYIHYLISQCICVPLKKMSVFDQLRPFVSFCQACGFIPYVIEYEPTTKKMSKFSFSWRNGTTWWFIFMVVSQVVVPFLFSRFLVNGGGITADKEAPITIKILMIVTFLGYVIQFIIARWIILRQRRQNGITSIRIAKKTLSSLCVMHYIPTSP